MECPAGFFCDTAGLASPKPCPPGTFNSLAGADSDNACAVCPAGSFCSGDARIASELCPANTYQSALSASGFDACAACPSLSSSTVGATSCAYDSLALISLLIFGSALLLTALAVLYFKKKDDPTKKIQYGALFIPVVAINDVLTDVLFIIDILAQFGGFTLLPILSTVSLLFAVTLSLFSALRILRRELANNPKFSEWWKEGLGVNVLLTILSSTNVEVLTLLGSNVGGIEAFSAPLTSEARDDINSMSFLSAGKKTNSVPSL